MIFEKQCYLLGNLIYSELYRSMKRSYRMAQTHAFTIIKLDVSVQSFANWFRSICARFKDMTRSFYSCMTSVNLM